MNQFTKLNQQYIGGVWRDGSSKTPADKNPYNGITIADFQLGSLSDLNEAYRSAAAAQKIWAEVNAFEKRAIMQKTICSAASRIKARSACAAIAFWCSAAFAKFLDKFADQVSN